MKGVKTGILDASSAIILFKAELHISLVEMYNIVMPQSVYNEITVGSLAGADEYPELLSANRIRLDEREFFRNAAEQENPPGMSSLGRGEYDVIQLYNSGAGDFVVTDDGAAARYCRRERIPFINALLVPSLLHFAGIKDINFCEEAVEKIKRNGRYSSKIISFAKECTEYELAQFLP